MLSKHGFDSYFLLSCISGAVPRQTASVPSSAQPVGEASLAAPVATPHDQGGSKGMLGLTVSWVDLRNIHPVPIV